MGPAASLGNAPPKACNRPYTAACAAGSDRASDKAAAIAAGRARAADRHAPECSTGHVCASERAVSATSMR